MSMLAKRVIPTILCKGTKQVKGQRFVNDRVIGHAMQSCRIHAQRGVDELVLLDVSATEEGREPDYDSIERLTESCFIPIAVGGGINKIEHIRKLLASGADKIVLGAAQMDLGFVKEAADTFGSQAIVVSLNHWDDAAEFMTYKAGEYERLGVGEILLQGITKDGAMKGYDLETIGMVSQGIEIPVIASGGCSGYEDMYRAIEAGASAVAAGALFQFTDATPKEAVLYLAKRGMEVRL